MGVLMLDVSLVTLLGVVCFLLLILDNKKGVIESLKTQLKSKDRKITVLEKQVERKKRYKRLEMRS